MSNEQQKGSGFVPIGELADTLPGVIPSGRGMSAQARHHFTTLRQVNRLIEVSEAEPDLGFMARLLALCSLPRTNPGNREKYVRRNGPHALVMTAGGLNKLPYGILPRLLLAWVCSEAVRTQRRELVLGRSLYEFMQKLGMDSHSGGARGDRTRLRNQMESALWLHGVAGSMRTHQAPRGLVPSWPISMNFGGTVATGRSRVVESTIRLGEEFFNEIIAHPIPLDLNVLKRLKRSPLGLDLYLWLTYRTFRLKTPLTLAWKQLYRQFGVDPAKATEKYTVRDFRAACLRELKKIKRAWPGLHYHTVTGGLVLSPSAPRIPPAQLHLISE